MATEFYATLAHVLPILLLALMWDSAYLERLSRQQRAPRRLDPAGVRFWTKPRVRVYALFVTGETVVSTAVAILVLANLIPDSLGLRIALSAGLALLLVTVLTRVAVDVVLATRDTSVTVAATQPADAGPDADAELAGLATQPSAAHPDDRGEAPTMSSR